MFSFSKTPTIRTLSLPPLFSPARALISFVQNHTIRFQSTGQFYELCTVS